MARVAGPTRTTRPTPAPLQGRRPKTEVPASPGKTAKPPIRRTAEPSLVSAPKPSKEQLRIQVEKLERANTSLRAKSREMSKMSRAAALRIADLEAQLADLRDRAGSQDAPRRRDRKPARPPARGRGPRERDPGDAVPPGVAVLEPAPLDAEAEAALESLEEHLGHG